MNDKILELFEVLFDKMLEWFLGPFRGNLDSLNTLIYGGGDKYYGIFDEKQFSVIGQGMTVMQSLSAGIILISIVMAGMRISSSGINPSNRTAALEYFKDFLLVALLFFNLSTIFELIFTVNSWFVTAFSSAKETVSGDMFDKTNEFLEKGPLGGLFIGLVMLGLWIWANFYYMMRTLTLIILTIMSPLAVALYLIPQTKPITGGLFKEYIGTVFVQSIHAALYWVIVSVATEDFGLGSILLYVIFIPVSESIRALLGLGGQMNDRLTKSAAMMGGGALMGVISSVKGALSGESVAQTLRNAAGKVADKVTKKGSDDSDGSDPKTLLGGAGTDIGSSSKAERMLKAGEIFSKGGKAVFGAAGAIAGSPMGPMGSVTGSTIGFSAGGVLGGVTGRAGMAGTEFLANRLKNGANTGWNKAKGILNADSRADEKLAGIMAADETVTWAAQNKDQFMDENKKNFPDISDASREQMWQDRVSAKRAEFLKNAQGQVGQLKSLNGQFAEGQTLVESTTNGLTNKWAKNNKEQFMRDYDANNPLPADATEGDILKHNQNKANAWQQAIGNKRNAISNVANKAISKLGIGNSVAGSYINIDDFAKEIGSEVQNILGTGERESLNAIKGVTSQVKGASLYSRKGVNTDFLQNHLASKKASENRTKYIEAQTSNGATEEEAIKAWETTGVKDAFNVNLQQLQDRLPKNIKLDHALIGNSTLRGIGAVSGGLASGVISATGIPSGIKQASNFISDTKLGHGVQAIPIGFKNAWENRNLTQNPITAGVGALGSGIKFGINEGMGHTADNVIGKQAAFRNTFAYATGIVGGVRGYKAGATYAAGGLTNSKAFGLKGFNPYNNAVNNQVSEISEIQQMVQTVEGPNGQNTIPSGAIRMVTTREQTVLQVKDKSGRVQTVSRIGSGDSGLKQGQSLFQDLTIRDGEFSVGSNVYQEDSAGGRIVTNRTINVNPNKLIANRNQPTNPSIVSDIQSYNQLVDSGQYYLKDAMNEMSNIKMVIERSRSYLVGNKDGNQYRISQYGPGDTRLKVDEVVERTCEERNNKLVVGEFDSYTGTLSPIDLLPENLAPYTAPNKRAIIRRQNDRARNKTFAGSLG